jgi:hypothetical protein
LCVNAEPYLDYCIQPPCGQLNPLNEHTYRILGNRFDPFGCDNIKSVQRTNPYISDFFKSGDLYKDLLDVFDRDIFHMGGDEISYKCWMAYEEITNWLSTHNTTELMGLWGIFQETGNFNLFSFKA